MTEMHRFYSIWPLFRAVLNIYDFSQYSSVCVRALKRIAYFHVEQYSTDFALFLCEREKKRAVFLNEI